MFKVVAALLVVPLIFSCSSFKEEKKTQYNLDNILVEDIEELLEKGSNLEALQNIDYMERIGKIESDRIDILRTQAIDSVIADYKKSYEEEDFWSSYLYFLSLSAVGKEDLISGVSKKNVLLFMADKFNKKNEHLSALAVYMKLLNEGDLTQEELEHLLDFTYQSNNATALKRVIEKGRATGLEIAEKYTQLADRRFSPQEMMKGTATVWVDKGIRVEKGIGYPDRVMGSGFFIDQRGYLLTNYHVIQSEVDPEYEGYSRLYIRMPGQAEERIPAKVIGWDRLFDIALLKVELEPKFVFNSFTAAPIQPGDKVFVIGSPVDPFLENTVTGGIISAVGRRRLLQLGDVIQLDAPVNPGNSGGPLINERGDLVGVVFAGLKPFEGLNFAIPIHWINSLYPSLYRGDQVVHSWLGMAIAETEIGLEVIYTIPGESAHRAGIQTGDILTSIDGVRFDSIRDVQEYVIGLPIRTLVTACWRRNESEHRGLLSVKERPFSPIELAMERDTKVNMLVPLFGMEVKEVGGFLETNYVVEKIIQGSIADNTGISVRDPVNLQQWRVDLEKRYVILQIYIKKKKAGFLESVLQMVAYMEVDNFI